MDLTKTSMLTGVTHTRSIDISEEQLAAWRGGACIQDVAPHLSAADREFVISGSTPEEWAAAFPEDEDDE